ncbi:MAG: single-stranded DNA-binding protein [Calditrichaeota bacterium]|nr:single-stranded DNA-binding protein [Calditrichota bacterium]
MDNVTPPLMTDSHENQESRIYSLPDVNRIAIAGVLQNDPPLRWTKKGVPVTNFIVATSPDQNGQIQTMPGSEECNVSVVVWAKQALQCKKYLHKGSSILILGELQSMPNADPENGFFPIQVNAQWIQYLDRGMENKNFEGEYS